MKRILLLTIAAILLASCEHGNHFMTDKEYRMLVHDDFMERQKLAAGRAEALFTGLDTLSQSEREAMEFLYAYMPYSDLADYDQSFFLAQVRTAFAAREEMPWGKTIPEDIFRHFVLVYRVNNEDLDTARQLMFRELKDHVRGLSMEQAALEVNHWCHEHVAYRASDSRTSAPLATMRTSYGRCGEESTFAVTALRSVGIPARQCYTPRWAHCDDNHAWVEVWIDGEWMFLGACEPDPKLNMGWFAVPSTRCMMVHTKAFGRYTGDEEVMVRTPLYCELNLLSHYAPTRRVTVTVCNREGRPVEGAQVKFKLYNYAEYYTLATTKTDDWGQTFITTGLGDLLVWVTDGTNYTYRKLDVRQDSSISVILGSPDTVALHTFEIVPPVAGKAKEDVSPREAEMNSCRVAYEDSLRNAYIATFPTIDDYLRLLRPNPNITDEQAWEIIFTSEGNYVEIASFLNNHTDSVDNWKTPGHFSTNGIYIEPTYTPMLFDYLNTYSDKDLRDITASVLEAHFDPTRCINEDYYIKGLLPARISNEMVRPYRDELAGFKGMNAMEIHRWVTDSIEVDQTGNYYNCPISPVGVYQLRHSDPHSRDIFFVAACRAAGIPAYLDNATNTIFTWKDKGWHAESFSKESRSHRESRLTLVYNGRDPEVPLYWPHFTIAKLENGDLRTFDFEDDPRMASFPAIIDLEPGTYCLSTGNRYPDGAVQSRLQFFELRPGENLTMEIVIPPLTPRTSHIGIIDRNIELFEGVPLWDYAGNRGMLYINLGNYGEPSKHLVVELRDHQAEMSKWGGMTFMVGPDNIGMTEWNLANTDIAYQKGVLEQRILEVANGNAQYPLVALINKEGNIVYYSEGYRIGTVEQILKAVKR